MRRILSFIAVLLVLAGCAKEAGNGIPMRVDPTVVGETKGGLDTESLSGFSMYVASADPLFCFCSQFTRTGGVWSHSTPLYWKNATDPVTYTAAAYGYHEFSAGEFKNGADLYIQNNQRAAEWLNAADLLYVPAGTIKYEDAVDGTIPLAFYHALARVNITITLGEDFYANGYGEDFSLINVFVQGTNQAFHFTPSTGEVTAKPGTAGNIKPFLSSFVPATAADKTAKAVFEVILVPQTLAAGELALAFNICEDSYKWSNADEITLKGGQTHNLQLSMTDAPARTNHINGHKYVDLGTGRKWATCNVGGVFPNDTGEQFYWSAVDPRRYSPWRFETNNNIAMSVLCNPQYSENDNLLPEHDAATSNWGAPWRTPTTEDWATLADPEKVEWEYVSDYNGYGYGYVIRSKVPGYEGNCFFITGHSLSHLGGGNSSGFLFWLGTMGPNGVPYTCSPNGNYTASNMTRTMDIPVHPVAD